MFGKHRHRKLTPPQIFGLLMLASALFVVLPAHWLRPAGNMTQLMALPQGVMNGAGQQIDDGIKRLRTEPVAAAEYEKVVNEKLAAETETASLRQRVGELEATVQSLTRLHQRGFPTGGTLIPARVIATDAAGRDSLLLGKADLKNVKSGDWVASRMMVQAGAQDGVREQLAVIGNECLIGYIESTGPLAARVVLLSDRAANKAMRVRIVPRDRKRPNLTSNSKYVNFALEGAGQGRMRITDIPREYIDTGRLKAGDLITTDPNNPRLPLAMVVGEIKELTHVKDKPVFYQAIVTPLSDPKRLSQVFVVDLSTPAAQPTAAKTASR
jgi:cell shape-determining protein MreC